MPATLFPPARYQFHKAADMDPAMAEFIQAVQSNGLKVEDLVDENIHNYAIRTAEGQEIATLILDRDKGVLTVQPQGPLDAIAPELGAMVSGYARKAIGNSGPRL